MRPAVTFALVPTLCVGLFGIACSVAAPTASKSAMVLSIGLFAALAATWLATDGGRSSSFLFLVTTTLFLGGRAIPVLLGADGTALSVISLGEDMQVSPENVWRFVLLVLASVSCIGWVAQLRAGQVDPIRDHPGTRFFRACFFLSLPLYLYKNVYYFSYLLANGGYLAIYQGTEHTEAVGTIPRIGGLLCLSSFVLYFFTERDARRLRPTLIIFLLAFCTELLVGLRGKFFTTVLVLLLFHKLRFGGRFHLKLMAQLGVLVIAMSLAVQFTREQQDATLGDNLLTLFLSQQGVSAGVLQSVLEYPNVFSGKGLDYFIQQFRVPFVPQSETSPGMFLADDLSAYLMPQAYALGFGTGSSYLAELQLLGGAPAIIVGSLAIGWLLRTSDRWRDGLAGAFAFWVVSGLVYYPRTMLHEPIFQLMRYGPFTVVLWACCASWLTLGRAVRAAQAR